MELQPHNALPAGGFTRREMLAIGALSLIGWFISPGRALGERLENDLKQVANIPGMTERQTPLLVFRDFMADPDGEVEAHIRQELSQHQALLGQIREKIKFEKAVHLSVEETDVQLMFVPQSALCQAAAYHRYCLDVTDYLFAMNQTDSFYAAITTPHESYPPIPETGVSAFIVHRLAKAYRAVCCFTAESGQNVKYRVSGAIFSNHLGAVDLDIEVLADAQFKLQRRPFTIWQNNSSGLFRLMAIPVEETLHYYLGHATDRQIGERLQKRPPNTLEGARQLADAWMAVEEAVVGGLVDRVLDQYCAQYPMVLHELTLARNATEIPDLEQYQYRRQGIEVVRSLGIRRSIDMYLESPARFKSYLDAATGT